MELTQAAIDYYDTLLRSDYFADTRAAVERAGTTADLRFDGRPLIDALRPVIVSEARYDQYCHATLAVAAALRTAFDRLVCDAPLRRCLRLPDLVETVLAVEREPQPGPLWNRLDALVADDGTLRFIEFNTTFPSGLLYADIVAETFFRLPVTTALRERFHARMVEGRPIALDVLRAARRALRGGAAGEMPTLAIPSFTTRRDALYSNPGNEAPMIWKFLLQNGVRALTADAKDYRYQDGLLSVHGRPVDLLVFVSTSALPDYFDPESPVFRALRDGAVRVLNGLAWATLVGTKTVFEILTDPEHAGLFDRGTWDHLALHVPWTRLVYDRTTTLHSQTIDLVPYVRDHRDRFALKPEGGYGGRGVVLGWESDAATWAAALHRTQTVRYVVQERVASAPQKYPVARNGTLCFEPHCADLNMFIWRDCTAVVPFARLSTSSLMNVSAGGSVTGVLIVDSE
jgi:hypothetical protein